MKDLLTATQAILVGVALTATIYWLLNKMVSFLPRRANKFLQPMIFIGPVILLVSLFLVIPTIQSIRLSFMEEDLLGETTFVGLENYRSLISEEGFSSMVANNLLWIAVVPVATVAIGLAIAHFANNVGAVRERIFKSIIFMPMAISFISAATIWRLLYLYFPEGQAQTGVFNAIWTFFGGEPQAWMQIESFKLNNLFIMLIFVWLNAGFAMVLLSAAIKAVPEETMEAARVDGASTTQVFFRIILPQIWPTTLAVFITILIGSMKVFDIVLAMTGGNYKTNVLAQNFYLEYFIYGNTGRAMATVVILMLAIAPVMVYQVRQYKKMGVGH